jgi:hypothetical protein
MANRVTSIVEPLFQSDAGALLRIGVAIADMSEFEAIDPAYGIGDQRAQVEALLSAESERAPLPGPVELVFRAFCSTSIDDKRSVADQFAADGVLAVIGARDFTYGSVRLAETYRIPVIDVNAVPRTIFGRTDPWLFTIRAAQDLVYLACIGWAHRRGLLDGRRIGVFSDRYTATSTQAAIDRLDALGYVPAVHVASDGVGVGSAHDVEAARRFQNAGVEVVLPFVSGSSLARLLNALVELDHSAAVVDLETGEHATDVSGSVMPAALYEGTQALVMSRVGEVAAGRPFDATAQRAVAAVESATRRTIARSGRDSSGELSNILLVADLVAVLSTALRGIEGDITRPSLVTAIERIDAMESASGGCLAFRSGEHWGCRELRQVEWRDGAWRVTSDYRRLESWLA